MITPLITQGFRLPRLTPTDIVAGRSDLIWRLDSQALNTMSPDGTNNVAQDNTSSAVQKFKLSNSLGSTGLAQGTLANRPILTSVNTVTKTIDALVCSLMGGIGGYPCLRFDGTNDGLLASALSVPGLTTPGTVYVVGRWVPALQDMSIIGDNGASSPKITIDSTGRYSAGVSNPWQIQGAVNSGDDYPHILRFVINGASSALWIDGVSTLTGTVGNTSAVTQFGIGQHAGVQFFKGFFGEYIACNAVHDAATGAAIETYLRQKWNMGTLGSLLGLAGSKVYFGGDSMVEGAGGSGTIRYWLKKHLKCMGATIDYVGPKVTGNWSAVTNVYGVADLDSDYQHGGYGGRTNEAMIWGDFTSGGAPTLASAMATYVPDVLIWHCGTNNNPPGGSWDITDRRTLQFQYYEVARTFFSTQPKGILVLCCPPYDNTGSGSHRDQMAAAINTVADVYRVKGFDVRVADMRTEPNLTYTIGVDMFDATHLNNVGNSKAASHIVNALMGYPGV